MRVLILGVTGQTGFYLAKILLSNSHTVYGASRSVTGNLFGSNANFYSLPVDLQSGDDLIQMLNKVSPDVIVNMAGLSSVLACEKDELKSKQLNFDVVMRILEYIRIEDRKNKGIKLIQASSSEMYTGDHSISLISETSKISPGSTYGLHKAMAHSAILDLRADESLSLSSLILFNHESSRRPTSFASRKITRTAFEISSDSNLKLEIGNLASKRDWGWAEDYAAIIASIIDQSESQDYVIASGALNSILDFIQVAFDFFRISPMGEYISIKSGLIRHQEHPGLAGDTSKLLLKLGPYPLKSFQEIVTSMCRNETLM